MRLDDNMTVNSLWIGNDLSAVELLTLHSFIDKGHHFRLWLYGPLSAPLPKELEICDANLIIPKENVFAYHYKNKYGHGKGSVAGFSDIFRYKLLYEKGGWWVDMDMACLKVLDFVEPYYFRKHHDLTVVGNIIKAPQGSELMLKCYNEAVKTIDANNTDWHKPIDILNRHIKALDMEKYIRDGHGNMDQWEKTNRFILTNSTPPPDWYFIHWQNEEWKYRKLSKTNFYYQSFLAKILEKHKLHEMPKTFRDIAINIITHFYNRILNIYSYI